MNTRILYIIATTAVLASSCIPDDRNNFMVEDTLSLTATGIQSVSVHPGSFSFGVAKNGKGQSAAQAVISSEAEDIASAIKLYNIENGTSLKAIPDTYFTLDRTTLSWKAEDVLANVTVSWDVEQLAALIGDSTDYVIALRLKSHELDVNGERSIILIQPVRSTLSISQRSTPRSVNSDDFKIISGKAPVTEETVIFDVQNTKAIPKVSMTIPVIVDNSLVEAFSAAQEETFVAAPEGIVTLLDESVTIASGGTDAQFKVFFDKKKLLDASGNLAPFPNYVIPIRLKTEDILAEKNGESFAAKGLGTGNTTVFFTIKYTSDGISAVVRTWGLYSQPSAWYSDLPDFTDNSDRTIAMDGQYVYVAHSAAAGGIYALSLTNGAFVKKLDIGDAASKGCTFGTSCVRMIPRDNGDDILSFCTLKGDGNQHLYVYAYTNGTGAAPKLILDFLVDNKPANTNDWRRYGDRYTVQGTWENGTLWFQTWSNGAAGKTLGFKLSGGTITNPSDPIDYYIPNAGAAIRDIVWYPGFDSALITSPNDAAFYTPGSPNPSMNQWQPYSLLEQVNDFALSYGYVFFSFHSKNYIAYTQMDVVGGTSGRLVIIEDTSKTPSDFPATLKAQQGRMEFPLQHASDFEAKSSVTSTSSVTDCTIRIVNGNTYIATLLNGGGLSLFQLQ